MKKVVLITGASSGIGRAIAQQLLAEGMVVYGTSRQPKNKLDNGIKMLALDVTKPHSIANVVTTILEEQQRLDVLVNNAGMGITGPIEETPMDEMRRVFETNFFGAIDVMKAVLPTMRAQRSGLVINITSIAGYMGLPFRGVYAATKGALALITEATKMEVKGMGIEVCSIAPGDFATNIAAGRYHSPVINGSDYEQNYRRNLTLMDQHVDKGLSPEIMGKVVRKIIQKGKPKTHYKVADAMQKFSIVLKRMLPDLWYQKLLMKHFDMKN
ncbi:SDR family oxidoreductase [Flavobacteriaceae bacterium F08102]|nr:SDR family oxidoreductase [Flavobacteriaceae bacterium F08102]